MENPCRLCGLNKPLCNSHLLPKSEYKRLTSPGHRAPVILNVRSGKSNETNRQLSQRLLCRDCENLFEMLGETPVLKVNHHPDGTFRLRDTIEQLQPVGIKGSTPCYTESQLTGIYDIDAFRYFAVSVFWRGSVVSWPMQTSTYTGSIKAEYELALRRYLLGHDKLPEDIGFMVQVDVGRPGLRVMHPPTCTETWDQFGYCSVHAFVIPGLRFRMVVGGLLKSHPATDDFLPMFSTTDFTNSPIQEIYHDARRVTTATGKLARKRV